MEQVSNDKMWDKMEKHGAPCAIKLLCNLKKTYTGAGKEYVPLGHITNQNLPIQLEEIKRGKNHALWGRLKSGEGWIELTDVQLYEANQS